VTRGSCTFRKADVKRVIEAVRSAGEGVARVEIAADGKVVVVVSKPDEAPGNVVNEWDEVLNRDAH
jgi:hypothetical protein